MSLSDRPAEPSVRPIRKPAQWAKFCLVAALLGYAALAGRLVQLQHGKRAEEATRKVASQVNTVKTWAPYRGVITDRKGQALAVSRPVYSCALDPKDIKDLDGTVGALRAALNLTPAELDTVYRRALADGCRFAWVRRHLSDVQAEAVKKLKLDGVLLQQEFKRMYPQRQLGAHIVGFTDIDGNGLEGIERTCDPILQGISARVDVLRDARNRQMLVRAASVPDSLYGLTVELTLDSMIQLIAEEEVVKIAREFHAAQACALVMEPNTGDILALVNYPSYDLNRPAAWPAKNRLNATVSSIIEPGSTFKPLVMASALEAGRVRPSSVIHCENGAWRMDNGRVLHDVHGYGALTAEGVLVKSSNIGIAKIAMQLGAPRLYDALHRFGMGERTGVSLPGELPGRMHPLKKWTSYSMGSVPMGQEIAVTPMQLVTAYSALANGGVLLKPRMVRCVRDSAGSIVYDVPVTARQRVMRPETASAVRGMLRNVVEEGTGKRLQMEEYELGGKTGTAQLPVNTAEYAAGERGYSKSRYVSNFIALAPYDRPRLIVFVAVREPKGEHYGGVVAAPAVKEISRRALQYISEPTRNDPVLTMQKTQPGETP